ncbi:hypothetical protein C6361_34445 [Plantactinospora sp. BC1]|uniref:HAD family hydrolase n=1 Tax=Plantactinospora sp. BC1 TaxID=2108470 RepID=UPI000D16B6BD|nr:HAD family hydrolase [Plantactinospora sp. BC1]AVT33698.1 hypothetical protein C6361_34445 [Plantactinospora sp. BC1]
MTRDAEAYLFDGAGTLFDCHPTLAEYIAQTSRSFGFTIEPADAGQALATVGGAYGWPDDTDDVAARKAGWLAFFDRVLLTCGARHHRAEHAEVVANFVLDPGSYLRYDDALPILRAVRDGGLKLGLVSNFDRWLRDVLRKLDLLDYFDVVTISTEVGVAKPDPRIFRAALGQLGVPAGRSVFVGDSLLADVAGAQAAGMIPVLLDRDGTHPDHPGWRVRSLDELHRCIATGPGRG